MPDKERLSFKIGLSNTSSKKQPKFKISIDGAVLLEELITAPANTVQYFTFNAELDDSTHQLEIVLLNKEAGDTIVENDTILDDMLLSVESIEINEIDLGHLRWSHSLYYPIYPDNYLDTKQKEIKEVKNCKDLGWNGTWVLPFSVPFYIWALENI